MKRPCPMPRRNGRFADVFQATAIAPFFQAQGDPFSSTPPTAGTAIDDRLILFAIFIGLFLVLVMLAIVFRKRFKSHHKPRRHPRRESPAKSESVRADGRGSRRRRKRTSHSDLPANPTLAQTGGLPPLRQDSNSSSGPFSGPRQG